MILTRAGSHRITRSGVPEGEFTLALKERKRASSHPGTPHGSSEKREILTHVDGIKAERYRISLGLINRTLFSCPIFIDVLSMWK